MVSWGDGEDSSTDFSSDASTGMETCYDSNFNGLDDSYEPKLCKHGEVAAKYVAFQGWCTGRRFFGCAAKEGSRCDYVDWVDPEWPDHMQKALAKLWEMFEEVKRGRVTDALDFMEQKFEFNDEKSKLHMDLRNAQDELKIVVDEKQLTLALKAKVEQALLEVRGELEEKKTTDACHSNMHKVLRIQAEKEKQKFKDDKKKLEYMIADLLKQKEQTRGKIRKIRELCEDC